MSSRARRVVVLVSTIALVLLVTRYCLAQVLVRFQPPHAVRAPAAKLDEDFARVVDRRIDETGIASTDQLLRLSLSMAGARLHFGLDHETTLQFGLKEREGNCIEYAHLFAIVFNRAADRKHVPARAYVVRSDARVLGRRMPWRGFADHDWVLVVPAAPGEQRFFVDPTLYDLGLDWDISGSVSGEDRLP